MTPSAPASRARAIAVGVSSSTRTRQGAFGGTTPIAVSRVARSNSPCCMSMTTASAPAATAASTSATLPSENQKTPSPSPDARRFFRVGFAESNTRSLLSFVHTRQARLPQEREHALDEEGQFVGVVEE